MTFSMFSWGGSLFGKSYSYGGQSSFGGKYSSWTNNNWSYDWCGDKSGSFLGGLFGNKHTDDRGSWWGDRNDDHHGGRDDDDCDDERGGRDNDDHGHGGRGGRDDDHGHGGRGGRDDDHGHGGRGDDDCDDGRGGGRHDDHGHGGRGDDDDCDDGRGGHHGGHHGGGHDDDDDTGCGDDGETGGGDDGDTGGGDDGDTGGGDDGDTGGGDDGDTGGGDDGDTGGGDDGDTGGGDDGGTSGKITVSFQLGDDQELTMDVSQTESGTLFFNIAATSWEDLPDLDGVFLNLSDDETAQGLHIHPDDTAIPVTGTSIDVNAVNSLANGTTLSENFDIGVQFGQSAGSTEGHVQQANFTLWSDNGPLTLQDVDLSRLVVVTDSDSADPQVIVGGLPDSAADEEVAPASETDPLADILSLMTQEIPDEDEIPEMADEDEDMMAFA